MLHNKGEFIFPAIDVPGVLVFIIFTVVPFVGWIWGYGPKKNDKVLFSYIDYSSNQLVEEREYTISFGNVFFLKTIKLNPISINSEPEITCKPQAGPRRGLPDDCYLLESNKIHKNINLKKNEFYDKDEVKIIYILEKTYINEDYKDNIKINPSNNLIEIINNNHHEIKQFPLKLPKSMTINNIDSLFGIIESWNTASTEEDMEITIFLNLPAKQGTIPGKKIIPLKN